MTTVIMDVSSDLLSHGLHDFLRHGLRIVGSEKSESEDSVRLLVEGNDIPAELHGKKVLAVVHQAREGLSFSTTLSFEAIK